MRACARARRFRARRHHPQVTPRTGDTPPMTSPAPQPRVAEYSRATNETNITVSINLDGSGGAEVSSGIGFLDHLLTALARHARFDLTLSCRGDLDVDDHHTAEDTALALGAAIDKALGERRGFERLGSAYA